MDDRDYMRIPYGMDRGVGSASLRTVGVHARQGPVKSTRVAEILVLQGIEAPVRAVEKLR